MLEDRWFLFRRVATEAIACLVFGYISEGAHLFVVSFLMLGALQFASQALSLTLVSAEEAAWGFPTLSMEFELLSMIREFGGVQKAFQSTHYVRIVFFVVICVVQWACTLAGAALAQDFFNDAAPFVGTGCANAPNCRQELLFGLLSDSRASGGFFIGIFSFIDMLIFWRSIELLTGTDKASRYHRQFSVMQRSLAPAAANWFGMPLVRYFSLTAWLATAALAGSGEGVAAIFVGKLVAFVAVLATGNYI